MLEIESGMLLSLADDIILKALPEGEQFYAFNVCSGEYFSLNHTAYWILNTIKSGLCFSELRRAYVNHFSIGAEKADKDLREVIFFGHQNAIIRGGVR
jgi:hypothetical protein